MVSMVMVMVMVVMMMMMMQRRVTMMMMMMMMASIRSGCNHSRGGCSSSSRWQFLILHCWPADEIHSNFVMTGEPDSQAWQHPL